MRTIVSDGTDQKQSGKCIAVYKMNKDKDLDLRSIQDVGHSYFKHEYTFKYYLRISRKYFVKK